MFWLCDILIGRIWFAATNIAKGKQFSLTYNLTNENNNIANNSVNYNLLTKLFGICWIRWNMDTFYSKTELTRIIITFRIDKMDGWSWVSVGRKSTGIYL